jgi:hypothetical protein
MLASGEYHMHILVKLTELLPPVSKRTLTTLSPEERVLQAGEDLP